MRSRGYARPLYLLPFDHRHSYETGISELEPSLTAEQHRRIADSKQVIYEGFRRRRRRASSSRAPAMSSAVSIIDSSEHQARTPVRRTRKWH
jgi:hypothetical protein